jgi:hypothetical protein
VHSVVPAVQAVPQVLEEQSGRAVGQVVPHAPQLCWSKVVSVQMPEQFSWPAAQTTWQAPFTQACPTVQETPHPPQLERSFWVSTHAPDGHSVSEQWLEQAPATQNMPEGQVLPQAPQLAGSLCNDAHAAESPFPHTLWPVAQRGATHRPARLAAYGS